MTKKKIVAFLKLRGKTQSYIAECFGVSNQSINRKIKNSQTAFDLADLIKLADLTESKLAFIDNDGKPIIIFDIDDLEQKKDDR